MKSDGQPTVVIPDVHARPELLEAVWQKYDGPYGFVIAGDIVDGPDLPGTLAVARQMGATLLLGNHEWEMLAAMEEADEERRYDWCELRWRRHETNTLQAYSVYDRPTPLAAKKLKEKMEDAGDYTYLREAALCFEGTGVNGAYVVTHAGITPTIWPLQRIHLRHADNERKNNHNYGRPEYGIPQLFGGGTITPEQILKRLAKGGVQPISIRGHFHLVPSENRIQAAGKLITLASEVRQPPYDPLYVYEDWTGEIVEIQAATARL